jgi:hypothetical protein
MIQISCFFLGFSGLVVLSKVETADSDKPGLAVPPLFLWVFVRERVFAFVDYKRDSEWSFFSVLGRFISIMSRTKSVFVNLIGQDVDVCTSGLYVIL